MPLKAEKIKIFLFFFAFYLINLTYNFSSASDGITYLNEFESSTNLFQPHHLFYHLTTYVWFKCIHFILPFLDNNYIIESINILWGAGALTVFYLILRHRFQLPANKAFIGTLLPGFSFGVWFYSTNIEVYAPPLFFIFVIVYLLSKPVLTRKDIWLIIFSHVLVILFHQVSVLLTPPILLSLFLRRKEINFIRYFLQHAIVGGGSVVLVYFLTGWVILGNNDMTSFTNWLEGYTNTPGYWFPLNIHTLMNACIGFGRAFLGSHFVFKVGFVENYMQESFFYHNLEDEVYLVRNMSGTTAMILLALTAVLILIAAYMLIRVLLKAKTLSRQFSYILVPLLSVLAVYVVFFIFWMPQIVDFWIPQTALVWAVLAGCWFNLPSNRNKKSAYYTVITLAALLLVINYFGSIRWLKNIDNDYYYAKVKEVNTISSNKDMLLLQDGWLIKSYIHRYAVAGNEFIPETGNDKERAAVDSSLQQTMDNGGAILLLNDKKSFFHSISNSTYIDSLLYAPLNSVDSLKTPLNSIKIIRKKQ